MTGAPYKVFAGGQAAGDNDYALQAVITGPAREKSGTPEAS